MRHDLVRKNTFLSAPVARLLHSGSSLTKYFSCCCSCQSISNSVRQYQSGDGKHTKTNNTNRLEHIKYLLNISPHWTLQSHVLRLLGKEGLERRDTKPIALKESIFTLLHRFVFYTDFHTHTFVIQLSKEVPSKSRHQFHIRKGAAPQTTQNISVSIEKKSCKEICRLQKRKMSSR